MVGRHGSRVTGRMGGVGIGSVLMVTFLAQTAEAQTIRGVVYEADSVRAVAGAQVRLLDQADEILRVAGTDTLGAFELEAPGPGWLRLGVEVFGYAPTQTSDFFIAVGDSLTLEIRVEYSAIPLDPLVVSVFNENRAGFERRKNLSYGTRLGPDVLSERGDMSLNEFAARRTPWLRWGAYGGLRTLNPFPLAGGGRCGPMIFIDGRRLRLAPGMRRELDRWVNPEDVQAIEVYPDGSAVPSPFWGLVRQETMGRPCSVIAVWTSLGFGGDGVPAGR